LGVGLPECFEEDITDEQIQNIQVNAGPLTEMERVLAAAKSAEISDSWVQALETCIQRNQLLGGLRECFEGDITDEQIRNIQVTPEQLTEMERVLAAAKSAEISDSWVQALETCIQHNQPKDRRKEFKVVLIERLPKPLIQLVRQLKRRISH
jgi:pyridoxine/pyridoxamine 5'-phosphate oxidase